MILLGLGAVALYLYFRNKPKVSAVTPKVEPTPIIPTTTKAPTLPALTPDKGLPIFLQPQKEITCDEVKVMFEYDKANIERLIQEAKIQFPNGRVPDGWFPTYQFSQNRLKEFARCGFQLPSTAGL
jgi:hypothetical protein